MLNSVVASSSDAVYVLINWVRDLSFSLKPYESQRYLTLAMMTADFAFTLDTKEAEIYMYRANFATSWCPPQHLRRESRINTLHEMLRSFSLKAAPSLREGVFFIW